MTRSAMVWSVATLTVAAGLWWMSKWLDHTNALQWIAAGVATLLVTILACHATVQITRVAEQPLPRLMVHTTLRLALPLAVLLAVRVSRPDLLDLTALIYYLPFTLITLIADVSGEIRRAKADAK